MRPRMVQVYVWQLPVRFYHWLNFLCVIVLCFTGYVINDPPALKSASEASNQYWFGTNLIPDATEGRHQLRL